MDTRLQHDAHGLHRGAVGPFLVAAAHPPPRGQRGRLGDADELHGEVAVGCPRVRCHASTLTRPVRSRRPTSAPPTVEIRSPSGAGTGRPPPPAAGPSRPGMRGDGPLGCRMDARPTRISTTGRAAVAGGLSTRRPCATPTSRPCRASGSQPVYGPADWPEAQAPSAWAGPGARPYTRGPYASMYRSKLWTMRLFAGFRDGGGHQRALPRAAAGRQRGAVGRLRPPHPHGPRLRRSPQRGGGGPLRRGGGHPGRRRGPLRRHRPGRR